MPIIQNKPTTITPTQTTKLAGVETGATTDQTGAEVVLLLQALTGNARLNASALRLIADAIDTELGAATWRTGGGGSAIATQDEGTELTAALATLNFAGEGVTATLSGGVVTVNIPGTGGVPPTHTAEQYLALKSGSDAFTAADFTDADRGVAFGTGSHTATAPSMPTGNVQLGLARLASDPAPNFLDINATGLNQFGALMQQSGTVTISGSTYNVWVHENSLPYQGATVEFR